MIHIAWYATHTMRAYDTVDTKRSMCELSGTYTFHA